MAWLVTDHQVKYRQSKFGNSPMCGRFNLTATPETIIEHFQLRQLPNYRPSYNISPAQKILCIVELEDKSIKAVELLWGLVPSWANDPRNAPHLINARAETLREKPSFRAAFHKRRCLIPATGFYEWQKNDATKQAYHIRRRDRQVFAFAGLWEHWLHGHTSLYSCTIITARATRLMEPIHDRMPVILTPPHYQSWLDNTLDDAEALQLLDNQSYAAMTATAIGNWVNNPLHDDERCLR